jgi:hypothetical protein
MREYRARTIPERLREAGLIDGETLGAVEQYGRDWQTWKVGPKVKSQAYKERVSGGQHCQIEDHEGLIWAGERVSAVFGIAEKTEGIGETWIALLDSCIKGRENPTSISRKVWHRRGKMDPKTVRNRLADTCRVVRDVYRGFGNIHGLGYITTGMENYSA